MPMKLIRIALSRLGYLADVLFDAISALLRVLIRARFLPDAKSFRDSRYLALTKNDVLVQEAALNAADLGQARRIINLDPQRHLPLSLEAAQFDITGPIDDDVKMRDRPERTYLLGVVRKETLAQRRATLPRSKSNAIEAFTCVPDDRPGSILVFTDHIGERRRRFRRAALAVALALFAGATWQVNTAWTASIQQRLASADAERVQVERRLRLAQRRAQIAQAELATLGQQAKPTLSTLVQHLSVWARRQPTDSELIDLTLSQHGLTLGGRAYAPDQTELELRRAFEHATINFAAASDGGPKAYTAQVQVGASP
jgi:hypothetical protein